MTRTQKNISRKIVKKIKSSVKYQDLIEDTKSLLSTVKYDLGRDEDLLLTGKSQMDGLGAHNTRHQLGYAGKFAVL